MKNQKTKITQPSKQLDATNGPCQTPGPAEFHQGAGRYMLFASEPGANQRFLPQNATSGEFIDAFNNLPRFGGLNPSKTCVVGGGAQSC